MKKALSVLMAGCLTSIMCLCPATWASPKLNVIASIFPLADFARQVGGQRVRVNLLVPPGASVHSWEPKPSDLIKLKQADLILVVGKTLEPWLSTFMEHNHRHGTRIIEALKGAPLVKTGHDHEKTTTTAAGHRHPGIDPHIWLDFKWDQVIVQRIADALSGLDPDGSMFYHTNAQSLQGKLERLDEDYRRTLASCSSKVLVIGGHAAFGYLARAYGLKQVSLYGLSPDARPTSRQMVKIVKLIKKNGIKAIFFDAATGDRLARTLALETGARILVLTPGANLSRNELAKRPSFLDLMYENLHSLADGLGCTIKEPK